MDLSVGYALSELRQSLHAAPQQTYHVPIPCPKNRYRCSRIVMSFPHVPKVHDKSFNFSFSAASLFVYYHLISFFCPRVADIVKSIVTFRSEDPISRLLPTDPPLDKQIVSTLAPCLIRHAAVKAQAFPVGFRKCRRARFEY